MSTGHCCCTGGNRRCLLLGLLWGIIVLAIGWDSEGTFSFLSWTWSTSPGHPRANHSAVCRNYFELKNITQLDWDAVKCTCLLQLARTTRLPVLVGIIAKPWVNRSLPAQNNRGEKWPLYVSSVMRQWVILPYIRSRGCMNVLFFQFLGRDEGKTSNLGRATIE